MSAHEKATIAGGCFWGVEYHAKKIEGVISAHSGYMGGAAESANYGAICTGQTDHAEVVQITFDPKIVSYAEILDFFWRVHDPTQLNRQGPDVGTQYRSAIFYHSDQQEQVAQDSKKSFDESGVFESPAVTQIVPATEFFMAEDHHQDYFNRNGGAVCHVLREK
jgi:methionine-S-sulfoxide reductase